MLFELTSLPPFVLKRVAVSASGCWLMTGYVDKDGYAALQFRGKSYRAHRWSFEFFKGPILLDDVDHECGHRNCIFPGHLVNKTHGDNIRSGCTGLHNRLRNVCNYGHPLVGENIIWYTGANGNRWRKCRACQNKRCREAYAKRSGFLPAPAPDTSP